MKKFLIVVDTQYDFVMPDGALYVGGAEEIIIPGIKFLANLDPEEYAGVLFTADTHYSDTYYTMPESEQFPIHCVVATAGWQNVFNRNLIPYVIPYYQLNKGVFSMWEEDNLPVHEDIQLGDVDMSSETPREEFFQSLKDRGIETVQVMGVASDYCVKWAVDGLVKRDFKVEVIQDLCRGIGQPANDVFEGVTEYKNVKLV